MKRIRFANDITEALEKQGLSDFPSARQIQEIIDKESQETDIEAEAFVRKHIDRGVTWFKELLWRLYSAGEEALYKVLRKTLALPAYSSLAPALRTAMVNPRDLHTRDRLMKVIEGKPVIFNVREVGKDFAILSKPRFKGMMGDIMGEREIKVPLKDEAAWREFEPAGTRVSRMKRVLGFDPEEEKMDIQREREGEERRKTLRPKPYASPEEDAWPEAENLGQEWMDDARDSLATDKMLKEESGYKYPVKAPSGTKWSSDIQFGIDDAIVELTFEMVKGYRGDYIMKVVNVGDGGTTWSEDVLNAVNEYLTGQEFSFFEDDYESGGSGIAGAISNIFSEIQGLQESREKAKEPIKGSKKRAGSNPLFTISNEQLVGWGKELLKGKLKNQVDEKIAEELTTKLGATLVDWGFESGGPRGWDMQSDISSDAQGLLISCSAYPVFKATVEEDRPEWEDKDIIVWTKLDFSVRLELIQISREGIDINTSVFESGNGLEMDYVDIEE